MAQVIHYLTLAGAPADAVLQVETAVIVGDITVPGDAEVIVTAAGMTGTPKTVTVAVGGVLQVETATVAGTITTDGNAAVVVTAVGMTGTPKTVPVAVLSGTAQVETAVVVGTIEAAGAGNAEVIVTAAGMTGTPKTVLVAVANDDTAAQVAGKIRTALIADADVGDVTTGFFTVTGADENVILTAKVKAANDATLNIAVDNDTCAGLTPDPTSNNATPGVAPDNAAAVAGKIRTALIADADVGDAGTGFFTVGGAGANIILTAKAAAANDATLNVSIDNDTCAGLTPAPTSANTTAGVAGDTAAVVAGKIRTALSEDVDVSAFFAVGGADDNVILTTLVSAANDATMNIAVDNDTCAGLTPDASSNNTTAGARGTFRGAKGGTYLADITNGILYIQSGSEELPDWVAQ